MCCDNGKWHGILWEGALWEGGTLRRGHWEYCEWGAHFDTKVHKITNFFVSKSTFKKSTSGKLKVNLSGKKITFQITLQINLQIN